MDHCSLRRLEFKFPLSHAKAELIKDGLRPFMLEDPHGRGGSYRVNSLYFDSPTWGCYWEKVFGLKDRKKVRLRYYGETLKEDTPVFLEIKRKNDKEVSKGKAKLPYRACYGLLSGQNLGKNLTGLSEEEPHLIEEFLLMIRKNGMRPKVLVSYWRTAFSDGKKDGFRVTFDSHIMAARSRGLVPRAAPRELFPGRQVMEVKFSRSVPAWFHLLAAKYGIRRGNFSKYCLGAEECTQNMTTS